MGSTNFNKSNIDNNFKINDSINNINNPNGVNNQWEMIWVKSLPKRNTELRKEDWSDIDSENSHTDSVVGHDAGVSHADNSDKKNNYKCPIEVEYAKIKIIFGNKLIKYVNNIKTDPSYFKRIYEDFFILWKQLAIKHENGDLYCLLTYLLNKEPYNIKKTIFDNVTNEKLSNPLYLKFITDFIGL